MSYRTNAKEPEPVEETTYERNDGSPALRILLAIFIAVAGDVTGRLPIEVSLVAIVGSALLTGYYFRRTL